jgi:cholest-4-en-3-one 26-monooxygenase
MTQHVPPFDFFDLDCFARGTPFDSLSRLRREQPVSWQQMIGIDPDDGFWLVTKHSDICEISRNTALFYSNDGSVLTDAPRRDSAAPLRMVRDGLCHLDPPAHTSHRQLVLPAFGARAIGALERRVRRCADDLLNRACRLRTFDLVEEVAVSFPAAVVFREVLGFQADEVPRAIYWGDLFNRSHSIPIGDSEYGPTREAASLALAEMHDFCLRAVRARRETPGDDVLSMLAHARTAEGEPIDDETFSRYFWSLVVGAFDTTASTIAGGVQALEQFPAQRLTLVSDPSLVPRAVEEMLRWVTPVIYFRRTAAADTELRGQAIKRGDRVAMCYAAANRDEDVFVNPEEFDVRRDPNAHLSFGYGRHFCLGAQLARMEIRVLFEKILERRLRFELHGEVRRARSNFINRIVNMPVTVNW